MEGCWTTVLIFRDVIFFFFWPKEQHVFQHKYIYDKCELIAMIEKKVMGIETHTSALQLKGR